MDLNQALTLATYGLEALKELNQPGPATKQWVLELLDQAAPTGDYLLELDQARQTITQLINRPDPGEFFISPPIRHRAGRRSTQIINT